MIFVIDWPPYPKSHSVGGAIHFSDITPVYRDMKLYCYSKCASALPRSFTAISISIARLVAIFHTVLAAPLPHARAGSFDVHSDLTTIITSSSAYPPTLAVAALHALARLSFFVRVTTSFGLFRAGLLLTT